MKRIFLLVSMLLFNLTFVLADASPIPKLSLNWDSKTTIVIIALGVALILLAIYWILQSMMRKDL